VICAVKAPPSRYHHKRKFENSRPILPACFAALNFCACVRANRAQPATDSSAQSRKTSSVKLTTASTQSRWCPSTFSLRPACRCFQASHFSKVVIHAPQVGEWRHGTATTGRAKAPQLGWVFTTNGRAIRVAERAEAEAWPVRMESYGGPPASRCKMVLTEERNNYCLSMPENVGPLGPLNVPVAMQFARAASHLSLAAGLLRTQTLA
jgi:hypothetical protein